jgi:hypothetical protein
MLKNIIKYINESSLKFRKNISLDEILDFLDLGYSDKQLSTIKEFYSSKNLKYRTLKSHEEKNIILSTLIRLEEGFSKSGQSRYESWEKGWRENLDEFESSPSQIEKLVPKYYKPGHIKRFNNKYIHTKNSNSEYEFFEIIRFILFLKYVQKEKVYEFGCGSPHNLVALTQQIPGISAVGCDWAPAAVAIVEKLAKSHNLNLRGELFDFFEPNLELDLESNSVVLDFGGLEQVGSEFVKFTNFLIAKKPKLVVHLEPINELYMPANDLLDLLAVRYHSSRNYLSGYLTYLRKMEELGKIDILKVKRTPFGGQFHDGWSLLVWRPVGEN